MTAMAAPVRGRDGRAIGVVTIAGPLVRLSEERMLALAPALMDAALDVAAASAGSAMFRKRAA
jgi:DNA-binding IclR family transcriptional regulator